MNINFKKLRPDAVLPAYAYSGDAGLDLTAVDCKCEITKDALTIWTISTGLAVEIPFGYVGCIFPRSSIYKRGGMLANSVGVVDSGYRGEILLKFYGVDKPYDKGDKCGQLMILPLPLISANEVRELSPSKRGAGGFGSSDAPTSTSSNPERS